MMSRWLMIGILIAALGLLAPVAAAGAPGAAEGTPRVAQLEHWLGWLIDSVTAVFGASAADEGAGPAATGPAATTTTGDPDPADELYPIGSPGG